MEYSMGAILDICEKCDTFALSFAKQIVFIPKEDKKFLIENHLEQEKQFLKERYDFFFKTNKNLPAFETVYNEIVEECKNFYKKFEGKNIIEFLGKGDSPFICDHVGKDTKYSEPASLFWHFYHNIQNIFMTDDGLKNIDECDKFDIDKVIIKSEDEALKNNYIGYKYTFESYYTKGPLQLILTFKLNEETKNWLLKFKDDYDLENSDFEDLTIYNGNKVEFASCTHEEFNSLSFCK